MIKRHRQRSVLRSPYRFTGRVHKVQLHAHSDLSDGSRAPELVMRDYARRNYAAVAITDHDYAGRTNPSLGDPGGHQVTHLPGIEYSADADNRSWRHLLAVMIETVAHGEGPAARQFQVDRAAAENGFAFACHPYGEDVHRRGWTTETILALEGLAGIEIYNGGSCGQTSRLACFARNADLALAAGRRFLLVASDDSHRDDDVDRGYIAINSGRPADRLKPGDVATALRTGNFFAVGRLDDNRERPPHFTGISVSGPTVTVTTDVSAGIEFITARGRFPGAPGRQRLSGKGAVACYETAPGDIYVRIEATVGRPGRQCRAWSNPIYRCDGS